MTQLIAFIKKEFLEQFRTGKLIILTILFALFGVMNPALAKLTPFILKLGAKQLAESGMIVGSVQVDALTSWTQFFKNMPISLIVFIIMFSGVFTTEYQTGTLINIITKGMKRWKILASKAIVMVLFWTVGYLISYGITYGYNAYFWDNSIAQNTGFAAFGLYFTGIWLITVIPLASAFFRQASAVTLSTGAAFLAAYLLGLLPDLKQFSPTRLVSSSDLLAGASSIEDYSMAAVITSLLIVVHIAAAVILFNNKNI